MNHKVEAKTDLIVSSLFLILPDFKSYYGRLALAEKLGESVQKALRTSPTRFLTDNGYCSFSKYIYNAEKIRTLSSIG